MHKSLFYNKFIICLYMFRALCVHHQEVKIVLYSIWRHHTCRWPSGAQVERRLNLCTGRPTIRVGTAIAQWIRCCATNRKVAGSIPDGVIGIFHWHNPSNRTVALGRLTLLTEMSTIRPVSRADNLTTILCRCHVIWEPYLPGTLWATPGL